jgi:hypothetical protein
MRRTISSPRSSERGDRLVHPRDRRLVARGALPQRLAIESSTPPAPARDRSKNAHARHRQRRRLYQPPLPGATRRARRQPPPRRLPRPRKPSLDRTWFGKLKTLVWRSEFETLEQARKEIDDYIDRYHHRPHSGLRYRTPSEVRRTRDDGRRLQKTAAEVASTPGSRPT